MKRVLLIIVTFLLFAAHAEAASVRAVVDKTVMTPEETLTLTVVITDGSGKVDTSSLSDFQVLSSGSSRNFQWINGKAINEYKLTYILSPTGKGKLTIPALSVTIGRKRLMTKPITITVDERAQTAREQRDAFVTASVTEKEPVEGQQIIYTFSLYYAANLSGLSLQLPDFQGFTSKEIDKEINRQVMVGGRQYKVIEKKVILVPNRNGDINIPPAILSCQVPVRMKRRSQQDPFDSFFNDSFFSRTRRERKLLKTNPLTIRVAPQPEYNGVEPFSGVVGSLTMNADLEKNNLKTGDSITLAVTIEGSGNIMDATLPEMVVPEGFKVYRDNPEEQIREGVNGYTGKKVFSMALVAVKPGIYTLPEVKLSYFDIDLKNYKTLKTEPFEITVVPSGDSGELNYVDSGRGNDKVRPGVLRKRVEYTGHDLLPLKEGLDTLESDRRLTFTQYLLLAVFPVIMILLVKPALFLTRRDESAKTKMLKRAEVAIKNASKNDIPEGDFLAGLYTGLIFKIRSQTGSEGETLTTDEAIHLLTEAGYGKEVISDVSGLMADLESFRFSGGSLDPESRTQMLERTRIIFRKLK